MYNIRIFLKIDNFQEAISCLTGRYFFFRKKTIISFIWSLVGRLTSYCCGCQQWDLLNEGLAEEPGYNPDNTLTRQQINPLLLLRHFFCVIIKLKICGFFGLHWWIFYLQKSTFFQAPFFYFDLPYKLFLGLCLVSHNTCA